MRLLISAFVLLLATSHAVAGISYLSNVTDGNNNKGSFIYNYGDSQAAWNPLLSANATAGLYFDTPSSAEGIRVSSTELPSGFQTYVGQSLSTIQNISGSPTVTFDTADGKFKTSEPANISTGSTGSDSTVANGIAVGSASNNYFVWSILYS